MKPQALCIFTFLSLVFVVSNAALPSESYWDTKMHGAPMPTAIKKLLIPEWVDDWGTPKSGHQRIADCTHFYYAGCYIINATFFFFLESTLQLGNTRNFQLTQSSNPAKFLPRKQADLVPFSLDELSKVMEAFFIDPTSAEAKQMRDTITRCESPADKGEEKLCATSLEAMIDFSISKLGKNVQALVSEIDEQHTEPQEYSIVGLKRMPGQNVMICHKQTYPYAVYHCHTSKVTGYKASLVGADGANARVVGVCHQNTSTWTPNHAVFSALKVKPGADPICHFLPGDHIVWTSK